MTIPRVYVHRAGPWHGLFMTPDNEAALASFSEVVSEGTREEPLGHEELIRRMRGCTAILSLNGYGASDITAEILRRVGTIRLICIAQHWGQFSGLREKGIEVVEGSDAATAAVGEWCLAAALMGVRRLDHFDRLLKAGSAWGEPRRSVGLLSGSTAGLVGLGRIGRWFARALTRLGVEVIAFSRSATGPQADALGVRLVDLDDLLRRADIVSLHHAVTDQTRRLLGRRELALIRPGATFINSARAALYDEGALITVLKTGRFNAYIDVFAVEPLPLDHPFRRLRNVTITPHIAGNNAAMFRRCAREAIATLRRHAER